MEELKRQRNFCIRQVTTFKGYLDSIDKGNLSGSIITELECRLYRFEPIYDQFCDAQYDLENNLDEEADIISEHSFREKFENSYFATVAEARQIIAGFANKNNRQAQPDQTGVVLGQQVRLPSLRLPNFDGSYNKWLEFCDAFTAMVDKNVNISDIEKFYYLKGSVSMEAAQLIDNIPVCAANYETAWRTLKDRYQNKKLIVDNYVKALFNTPAIVKESHSSLRNLYDEFNKNLRALETLGQPVDSWDALLIHMLSSKFDSVTLRDWQSFTHKDELPSMTDMHTFLKAKCELLERMQLSQQDRGNNIQDNKYNVGYRNRFPQRYKQQNNVCAIATRKGVCYFCQDEHVIHVCKKFKALSVNDRTHTSQKLNLCTNCLCRGHFKGECKKLGCKKCSQKHHSLLHVEASGDDNNDYREYGSVTTVKGGRSNSQNGPDTINNKDCFEQSAVVGTASGVGDNKQSTSFLSTAAVYAKRRDNSYMLIRVLLDPGSQSNFIRSDICEKLDLEVKPVKFSISGVGTAVSTIKHSADVEICSTKSDYKAKISCLLIDKITEQLPSRNYDSTVFEVPSNVKGILADPEFNKKGDIDMLLSCNVFYDILLMQQLKRKDLPTLQNTRLGWILGGNLGKNVRINNSVVCHATVEERIEENLTKFWQVEEKNYVQDNLKDDFCNEHFLNTYHRNVDGRFIVKIPFKDNLPELGDTEQTALSRFYALERKLDKDNQLKQLYTSFMSDYENLGHMKLIDNSRCHNNAPSYYLPHHSVFKASSVTTKMRVVFDASAKPNIGLSLNEVQYGGPTIQSDLFSILLRFRCYAYVFSADISKMFRQILIHPDHRRFQRIFWRPNTGDELQTYELQTVTYGTASAAFLAVRCLYQLGVDYASTHPQASSAILRDIYMDDILTGTNCKESLIQIQNDVSRILASGGFELRKWLSNDPTLLENFTINNDLDCSILRLGENEQNKTLGIYWNPNQDTIGYSIDDIGFVNRNGVTKRLILSVSSQIFDPLGLLGPVIVSAKLILQNLWQAKLSWDQTVPQEIYNKWIAFCNNLKMLNEFSIPRYVMSIHTVSTELHCYGDASEAAYGACIYIKQCFSDGSFNSNLLCAKSRVAPLKTITLPRLELCAAILLVDLVEKVKTTLNITYDKCLYYTDSTIVLSWIRSPSTKWKTFVANRVSKIQGCTSVDEWRKVKSCENPADLLSRGVSSDFLLSSSLWWQGGPSLMSDNVDEDNVHDVINIPESKAVVMSTTAVQENDFDLFERYSSLNKLVRVTTYCLRFVHNIRYKDTKISSTLSATELDASRKRLVMISQIQSFPKEYISLQHGKQLSSSSKILSLSPFLAHDNLIRVGGRIKNANLPYSQKHPILLHNKHTITKLLLLHEHERLLHCGPQQLLYSIREQYWPISGRCLARNIVHKCVKCFKAKPTAVGYKMGDLPAVRVNQNFPFCATGVDYAGPILIKDRIVTRNYKTLKAYICVFICMSTKAVHLELVTSLNTQSFLATLRRFISRRGKPQKIYSDNGTTFVGANSEFAKFILLCKDDVTSYLAQDSIEWSFIPPYSPNFGGLWESGVRLTKFHLKRVLGNTILNFEEFSTLLAQIESILNSRPLSPLSSDPTDLNPLTPAHFLLGRASSALPEPSLSEVKQSRLDKYQHIQQILQHYWQRWSTEYISELQGRTKWKQQFGNLLKVGTLVVIKDDQLPVLKWRIGRVVALHPGRDNTVRVASVKCADGSLIKRAVSRMCVLPID